MLSLVRFLFPVFNLFLWLLENVSWSEKRQARFSSIYWFADQTKRINPLYTQQAHRMTVSAERKLPVDLDRRYPQTFAQHQVPTKHFWYLILEPWPMISPGAHGASVGGTVESLPLTMSELQTGPAADHRYTRSLPWRIFFFWTGEVTKEGPQARWRVVPDRCKNQALIREIAWFLLAVNDRSCHCRS